MITTVYSLTRCIFICYAYSLQVYGEDGKPETGIQRSARDGPRICMSLVVCRWGKLLKVQYI